MLSKKEIIAYIEKIMENEREKWENLSYRADLTPQELFDLGECYLRGIFAPLDFERAYDCFSRSASLGCADGYYGLSYMYSYGLFVEADEKKSFELGNKAIELGSAKAIDFIGVCHYSGIGTSADREKGFSIATKATESAVPNAFTNVGAYYSQKKEYEKAYEYFEKGLINGSLNSISRLGLYFLKGFYVEKDEEFAVELFKRGSALMSPHALCYMASIYLNGSFGEKRDYKKAYEYLTIAEKKKYKHCYYYLVLCYLDGKGVLQNVEKASYYIDLCEKNGVEAPGKIYMANKYIHSLSYIKGNKERGFEILKEYRDSTDGFALSLLAKCYAFGIGTGVDFEKAKYYYEKSYEAGYDNSLVYIGDLYFNGRGTEFNMEKAGEYYLKGKEEDIPLAFTHHGNLLKYIWERKNPSLVIEAYEEAVKRGCYEGMAELGNFLIDHPYIYDKATVDTPITDIISDSSKRALELLERAKENGETKSYFALGKYYQKLYGMNEYAKENYLLALATGTSEACLNLAEIAIDEKNYVAAIYYYKQAQLRGWKNLDKKIEELQGKIDTAFVIEDFTLVKCDVNFNAEAIPFGIKVIGKEAFRGNLKMKKTPELPSTVEAIEDRAFMECRKLRIINLSSLVKYMGKDIFLGTFPRKTIYYYVGGPRLSTWNIDYDVIRRFDNGKTVRLKPKKGKTKHYSIVGYNKNGKPRLKRTF